MRAPTQIDLYTDLRPFMKLTAQSLPASQDEWVVDGETGLVGTASVGALHVPVRLWLEQDGTWCGQAFVPSLARKRRQVLDADSAAEVLARLVEQVEALLAA